MAKYMFITNKKKDLLKGRTVTYVSSEIIGRSKSYIINILNGKISCSNRLAEFMVSNLDPNAIKSDYFTEV